MLKFCESANGILFKQMYFVTLLLKRCFLDMHQMCQMQFTVSAVTKTQFNTLEIVEIASYP